MSMSGQTLDALIKKFGTQYIDSDHLCDFLADRCAELETQLDKLMTLFADRNATAIRSGTTIHQMLAKYMESIEHDEED